MKLWYRSPLVRNSCTVFRISRSTILSMKLITTRIARYNCTAPTRTKGLGSPAKGPSPRLAKYDAISAAAAANAVHQRGGRRNAATITSASRSEEHTSELQSPDHLVCRLLLEKKNKQND